MLSVTDKTDKTSRVVVVGGANIDIRARCNGDAQPKTSNPGVSVTRPGGVGRNIAESLARLGDDVHLVAPVGRDAFGTQLLAHAREAGIDLVPLRRLSGRTGSYTAILDEIGELVVAVADMAITDALTPDDIRQVEDEITTARAVVIDANLPVAVADYVAEVANRQQLPVILEPVSVAKAKRVAPMLKSGRAVLAVTPNVDELEGLLGHSISDTLRGITDGSEDLHALGVQHVWVRRGPNPSVLCSVGEQAQLIDPPPIPVVDVTGGGDAMTAGFTHALLRGDDPLQAARFGQHLGALTVGTADTVVQNLTEDMVDAAMRGESLVDLLAARTPRGARGGSDDQSDRDELDEEYP